MALTHRFKLLVSCLRFSHLCSQLFNREKVFVTHPSDKHHDFLCNEGDM